MHIADCFGKIASQLETIGQRVMEILFEKATAKALGLTELIRDSEDESECWRSLAQIRHMFDNALAIE